MEDLPGVDPSLLASLDQMQAHLRSFTHVLHAYYTTLLDAGFETDIAKQLVIDYHEIWFRRLFEQPSE